MPKRRRRGLERRIALERIHVLFHLAREEALRHRGDRARRYVDLARRIGMRYNVRMPAGLKRRFCRRCHAYFLPPTNARVRVARGRITVTCLHCGAVERVPYVRERVARRRGTSPSGGSSA